MMMGDSTLVRMLSPLSALWLSVCLSHITSEWHWLVLAQGDLQSPLFFQMGVAAFECRDLSLPAIMSHCASPVHLVRSATAVYQSIS